MERARTLLLVVLVPGVMLILQGIDGEKARPSWGTTGAAGAAGPDPEDEGDSAAFMVLVERRDRGLCAGSLVSARTVLTSPFCARRDLSPLWVRAQPGPARRVSRLVVSAGSTINLALLELEMALGPPARAIVVATVSAECAAPAACHVVCARSRRLHIVDDQLVPTDACATLLPRSLDGALCLSGAPLCSSDSGAGVICAGKLCGVVGDSETEPSDSPKGARCGSPRVAVALPRNRRFLQCAHRPAACIRVADCKHICTETLLLEEESVLTADSSTALVQHSELFPNRRARPTARPPFRSNSEAGDPPWVFLSAESPVPECSPRRPVGPATRMTTRTAPALAPSRSPETALLLEATAATADSEKGPTRSQLEFEPNRADFKPGEYGDNAAEYAAEEPVKPARTATASVLTLPTVAPAPVPALAAAELAVQVLPAEEEPTGVSRSSLQRAAPVPVALLLVLRI